MHDFKKQLRTFFLVLCLAPSGSVCAEAVTDVDKPFKKSSREFEWFDAEQGRIRARNYAAIPSDDPAHRKSLWETDVNQNTTNNRRASTTDNSLLLNILAWFLVAVLVVGVFTGLLWGLFRQADEELLNETTPEIEQETEAERVERLPFHIQAAQTDLLAEVRRHAEQMNYTQATIYFYSYLLVELDKYQVIRLEPGKTNRMYVRDVVGYPPLAGILAATVAVFEDAFFGKHEIERARFERCWNQLPAFQQFLAQGGRE